MALGLMPDVLRASDAAQLEPQDFLIRGMALDKSGFMVVGDSVRVGQQIRFMVGGGCSAADSNVGMHASIEAICGSQLQLHAAQVCWPSFVLKMLTCAAVASCTHSITRQQNLAASCIRVALVMCASTLMMETIIGASHSSSFNSQ